MVKRELNTKELIARQGGELKGTSQGFTTTGTQPAFRPPDQGSETNIIQEGNFAGLSGVKFDVARSFFARKGVPDSLARTYGASLLEVSRASGRDITELVQTTKNDKIQFTNESLAHINTFRSKTSQIGYRLTQNSNTDVERTILP